MNKSVWLIGPGNIGLDYAKVLLDQNVDLKVIGRSSRSGWLVPVYPHGISKFINENQNNKPDYAIIAVDESQLYDVAVEIIDFGIENILIEKPAGISIEHIKHLHSKSLEMKCKIFVAYNRRFYKSIEACKKMIMEAGEDISVNFTFTEWTHSIPFDWYNEEELQRFFLCNSSHVPDTVFYLVGQPKELHCYTDGGLPWHSSASIFSGAGVTDRGIPISYNANWNSAGRWGIEIDIPDKKIILKPLEELKIIKKGTLVPELVDLDNGWVDIYYKPGLFEEVKSFLGTQEILCTIKEQLDNFLWYYKMANYF